MSSLIAASKLPQKEIGAALGVKQASVSQWKVGTSLPEADKLAEVADFFGVNGHWLLTGEGPMEPPGRTPDLEAARAETAARVARSLESAVQQVVREVMRQYQARPATASAADHLAAAELAEQAKASERAARQPGRGAGSGKRG